MTVTEIRSLFNSGVKSEFITLERPCAQFHIVSTADRLVVKTETITAPARLTEKQIADVREAFAYFDLLQIFHGSHLPEFRPGLK